VDSEKEWYGWMLDMWIRKKSGMDGCLRLLEKSVLLLLAESAPETIHFTAAW
jgi:hypothetical protein